jgi:hypothetical protein
MGYELHITRAEDWLDSEENPIAREEWLSFARERNDLVEAGWIDHGSAGREPVFEWVDEKGKKASLFWSESAVTISGAHGEVSLQGLVLLAVQLEGRLFGDDGEEYD